MSDYYDHMDDPDGRIGFFRYLQRWALPETRRIDWGYPHMKVDQYMFALIDGGGWKMIERRGEKKYRVTAENKVTGEKIKDMIVDTLDDAMEAIKSIEKKGE